MSLITVSIYHNEQKIYYNYINGLYGNSGFKLSDRGYILNRNSDSENTKYLKEHTPENFSILERNYDLFRFDIPRNDIYIYASDEDSKLSDDTLNYIMPSIDHFTTDKKWKEYFNSTFLKIEEDICAVIFPEDITKYNIIKTSETKDPIKIFKKQNYDYFVNYPISEDFVSTKNFSFYSNEIKSEANSYFIHVHYLNDNPNHINEYFRDYLYYLIIFEFEEHLYEFNDSTFFNMISVCFYNICECVTLKTRVSLNFLKKLFNFFLKVKKELLKKENFFDREFCLKRINESLFIIYMRICLLSGQKVNLSLYKEMYKNSTFDRNRRLMSSLMYELHLKKFN